jgi:hypothetical protein
MFCQVSRVPNNTLHNHTKVQDKNEEPKMPADMHKTLFQQWHFFLPDVEDFLFPI